MGSTPQKPALRGSAAFLLPKFDSLPLFAFFGGQGAVYQLDELQRAAEGLGFLPLQPADGPLPGGVLRIEHLYYKRPFPFSPVIVSPSCPCLHFNLYFSLSGGRYILVTF